MEEQEHKSLIQKIHNEMEELESLVQKIDDEIERTNEPCDGWYTLIFRLELMAGRLRLNRRIRDENFAVAE